MANGSDKASSGSEEKCPVMHGAMTRNSATGTANSDWWPEPVSYTHLPLPTICRV